MYVHIPTELIEEHPWIGVLIGLVGVGFFGWLAGKCYAEHRMHSRAGGPAEITVETARLSEESPRKWVTLRGGVWHWDRAVQLERQGLESRFLGRIRETQIPVTDADLGRTIVVKFDGDVEVQVAEQPVTGVLMFEGDRAGWGGSISAELTGIRRSERVLVLAAGAGPKKAMQYALGFGGAALGCAAFTAWFWGKWARKRREARRHLQTFRPGFPPPESPELPGPR
ncbi:MAG: hypothetical protein PVH68_17385 [Armatimonadota bacterium]|jgi:hypothetical protein